MTQTRLAFEQRLGWIVREQFTADVGVDAQAEVVQEEIATGRLLALQIKGGQSFFRRRAPGGWWYQLDSDHVDYWMNHVLAVVVVLHNPDTGRCYWQIVNTETLRAASGGRFKLLIPEKNLLDEAARQPLLEAATGAASSRGEWPPSSEDLRVFHASGMTRPVRGRALKMAASSFVVVTLLGALVGWATVGRSKHDGGETQVGTTTTSTRAPDTTSAAAANAASLGECQPLDALKSDDIDVRVAAIKQIDVQRDSCQHFREETLTGLSTLLHEQVPYPSPVPEPPTPPEISAANPDMQDVYLAMQVLASEGFVPDIAPDTMPLNLEHLNLSDLQLGVTADLSGVSLADSQIDYYSDLRGADFHDADLTKTQLDHAWLSGANFDGATAVGTYFIDNILEGASFNGTDVRGADFRGGEWGSPACLINADLSGAIGLDEAFLDGVVSNTGTKWPPAFDPRDHGVIKGDECKQHF